MLRGICINLYEVTQTGVDDFNHPLYAETEETVEDVLVMPMSETEILDTLNLTGKKAIYKLAIPKGDTHEWENRRVSFFGKSWRVIGKPVEGIEALLPLRWNRQIRVESYVNDGED